MKNINLDDLFCSVPSSNYSNSQIELLAESIVATGGLLRPLIVAHVPGAAAFEVLDGNLPYYAAIRASEEDVDVCEVPCWVLADPEDLQYALEQLECLASIGHVVDSDDFTLPVRGGV